jgi:hypothetical protein
MLIKSTTSNHIFGAYTSQGWKLSTDFYGDSSTFLFSFSKEEEIIHLYFNYGSKWNKFNGIGIEMFVSIPIQNVLLNFYKILPLKLPVVEIISKYSKLSF